MISRHDQLDILVDVQRLNEAKEEWKLFVKTIEDKEGADFKFRCPHLAKLDSILGEGKHVVGPVQ